MKIYEISKSPLFEISKAEKKRLQAIANQQKFDAAQQERDAENKLKSDKLAQITQMRADVQAQAIANQQEEEEQEKRRAERQAKWEAEKKRMRAQQEKLEAEKYMQISAVPKEYRDLRYPDSNEISEIQSKLKNLSSNHGKIISVGLTSNRGRIEEWFVGKLQVNDRTTNRKKVIDIKASEDWKVWPQIYNPKNAKDAAKLAGILLYNDIETLINYRIVNNNIFGDGKASYLYISSNGEDEIKNSIDSMNYFERSFNTYEVFFKPEKNKYLLWKLFSLAFPNSSFDLQFEYSVDMESAEVFFKFEDGSEIAYDDVYNHQVPDYQKNDDSEDQVDLGNLPEYAASLGDDLWTVSAVFYDGLLDRETKSGVFTQLNKTARTLPELTKSINTLKTAANQSPSGSISAIVVNGLTGESAVFYVEPGTEAQIIPEDFLDNLDFMQARKINRITNTGSRYSKAITKFLDDPENYNLNSAAEDSHERVLWALNYEDQKFPIRLTPADRAREKRLAYFAKERQRRKDEKAEKSN